MSRLIRYVSPDGGDMGRGWGLAWFTRPTNGIVGFFSMQYPRWLTWLFWPLHPFLYRGCDAWSFPLFDPEEPARPRTEPAAGYRVWPGLANAKETGYRVSYLLLPLRIRGRRDL